MADLVPEARQPRAYAIVYWAINLGAAVGPALGGLIAERSYTGLFVLDGVSLFAYAAIVLVSVPETRPAVAEGTPRCAGVGGASARFASSRTSPPPTSSVLSQSSACA